MSVNVRHGAAVATTLFLLSLVMTAVLASAHTTVAIPADDHVTVLTLTLKQGDKVDYSYTAQGSVKYEIVLVGGSEQLSMSGLSGNGRFEAPTDGTYSFRFENLNPDVSVNVSYAIKKVESSAGLIILIVLAVLGFLALIALIGFILLRGQRKSGQPPAQ